VAKAKPPATLTPYVLLLLLLFSMAKLVSRAEQKLIDSGASIAPPERICSSAVVMPAPVISTHSTHQRCSDVLAMSSMSDNVADIPEVIEEIE